MKVYNSLLSVAFFITACTGTSNQKTELSDSSENIPEVHSNADTEIKTYTGLFSMSDDGNVFQDCETKEYYWLADSSGNLKSKYQENIKPLEYPNETAYAEVKGYLAGKASSGQESEFGNVLVVKEIEKTEAKNFRTACYPYEFIALGNEPFWSLDINPATQQIVLKDLSQNKVFLFPYQPANIGGGVHRFETKNEQKDKLTVVIREENCTDGMSDNVYHYSAEVTINSVTLKGCAVKKGDF